MKFLKFLEVPNPVCPDTGAPYPDWRLQMVIRQTDISPIQDEIGFGLCLTNLYPLCLAPSQLIRAVSRPLDDRRQDRQRDRLEDGGLTGTVVSEKQVDVRQRRRRLLLPSRELELQLGFPEAPEIADTEGADVHPAS